MSQRLRGTHEEFGQRLEAMSLLFADAKLDIMILFAENQILEAQIETEKKALAAQGSILANLSREVYECSLTNSENSIDGEEVEKLRQRNEELRQKIEEMLEDTKRRNREIGKGNQWTEGISQKIQHLKVNLA